jgi:NAD(P)-dependent dehydrogenase (short-subunit alcohol dehydrogenase family)
VTRVIVTGAGSGIGQAMVQVARERGWHPIAWDLTLAEPVDVASEEQVEQALDRACVDGTPELAVCAAGVLVLGNVTATSAAEWRRLLSVNVMGAVHTLAGLARRWERDGVHGRAVVVSSMAGERGMEGGAAYSASKAALNALVRSAALEWAPLGHRINAVLPGSVDTPLLRRFVDANGGEERERELVALQPMRRFAQPDEIARICAFLLSSESSYVTGALIAADGALALGYG